MIHVFICNYNAMPHLQNCLHNLQFCGVENVFGDVKFKIHIVDNASKDDSIDFLQKIECHDDFDVLFNTNNIGKAKAINSLVEEANLEDDDIVFSLDSDISLVNNNFFVKLQEMWHILNEKVSCLVCWQTGNSLFKRSFEWSCCDKDNLSFKYFVPKEGYGNGIAGGAIVTSYKNWKLVRGYREDKGLYGGNDGNLMLDLFKQTNKPICVVKDLSVHHPYEVNGTYQLWKDNAHQQQLLHGKCIEPKGFYDE